MSSPTAQGKSLRLAILVALSATSAGAAPIARTPWQRARTAIGERFIGGMVKAAALIGNRLAVSNPSRYGVTRTRNIAYQAGGSPFHTLDVYQPAALAAGGSRPIVVYVHGGGFTSLSKDTHHTLALEWAKAGYTVFNINYRLAPKNAFPAAPQDVFSAYEWVVKNAARYGGDVNKIVLDGESAGGNLITTLALATTHELDDPGARRVFALGVVPRVVLPASAHLRVAGAALVESRQDLSRLAKDRMQGVEAAYLGPSKVPGEARTLAEPLQFLERRAQEARSAGSPARPLPKFFAIAGTKDPLVEHTVALGKALDALRVQHEVRLYEGEGHAFHAMRWKDNAQRAWADRLAYTQRALAE